VQVLAEEKSKRIYHSPELLPNRDELNRYHNMDDSYWFWEKYPIDDFNRVQITDEDKKMI